MVGMLVLRYVVYCDVCCGEVLGCWVVRKWDLDRLGWVGRRVLIRLLE